MNTKTLLLGSLLLTACGPSELREDAPARALMAAEKVRQHSIDGDMAAVAEQMTAELLPGGEATKRALIQQAKSNSLSDHQSMEVQLAKNMIFDTPQPIHTVGRWRICVLTYKSNVNGRRIKACQIAVSLDDGSDWSILSGGSQSVANLQQNYPHLYAAIEDEIQPVALDRD